MRRRPKVSAKTLEEKSEMSVSQTPKTDPSHAVNSSIDYTMSLQRTIGNQAVQGLLNSGMIQTKLRVGQSEDAYEQKADRVAERVPRTPDLRQAEPKENGEENQSQTELLASQITPLIQRQSEDALEARKRRGQQMAKDIIGAIKAIRDVYLKRFGVLNPMTIVLDNTIKRRKGPWDQYLTIDDVKKNYKTRDVRNVSYMERTLIEDTKYGLVNGWTFLQIAERWNGIWNEAVQAVAYVRRGLQQYDVTYRPMLKWMLEGRYKDSVLFYLVTPELTGWKWLKHWLTH